MGEHRGLTREAILTEALELIDDVGLRKFSMRKLAERLDVDPMSIYHHVAGREAIFDGVVELLMREANLPTDTISWQDWVRTSAAAFADLAERHPHSFLLLAMRSIATKDAYRPLEALADAFARAGFRNDETMELVEVFSRYATSIRPVPLDTVLFDKPLEPPTQEDAPPDEFPRFNEAVTDHVTTRSIFDRGLNALIAGFEQELNQRH